MSSLEDIFIVIYSIKSIWKIKSCLLLHFLWKKEEKLLIFIRLHI